VKMFDADKTGVIGLPYGEKNYGNMLSRFHLIPERHGQTDGHKDGQTDRQTDRQNCYINIARQHRAGKSIIQLLLHGHHTNASLQL